MDFVRPPRAISMSFISGKGHYDTVIRRVREARTSVWIATANLKELMVEDDRWSARRRRPGAPGYRSIVEIFAELARAGVELRLLHASPPSGPLRAELARHPGLVSSSRGRLATIGKGKSSSWKGRLEMRLCPRVHLKTVVVDGEFLYLGSANWTGAGLGAKGTGRRNFELGFVSDDPPLLDDVQELFDGIWRGRECAACKRRDICPSPLDVVRTKPAAKLVTSR